MDFKEQMGVDLSRSKGRRDRKRNMYYHLVNHMGYMCGGNRLLETRQHLHVQCTYHYSHRYMEILRE